MYKFKKGDIVASSYFTWNEVVIGTTKQIYENKGVIWVMVNGKDGQLYEDPIEYWIPYAEYLSKERKRKIKIALG